MTKYRILKNSNDAFLVEKNIWEHVQCDESDYPGTRDEVFSSPIMSEHWENDTFPTFELAEAKVHKLIYGSKEVTFEIVKEYE